MQVITVKYILQKISMETKVKSFYLSQIAKSTIITS